MKSILLILLVTSCATESLMLKKKELLPYKESSQLTKLQGLNKSINLTEVTDLRKTNLYGSAYTGVQYRKTPLTFDETLNAVVSDYMTSALEMRNIQVNVESEVNLVIEVEQMWVEEVIEKFQPEKVKCNVKMNFHVNLPNTKWSGSYWAEYLSAGNLGDGTEKLAPTLASCMNEIVEKLINDKKFINLLR